MSRIPINDRAGLRDAGQHMSEPVRSKRGKVALVTGAGRGLGLAFARRLAGEGATVVAVDRAPAQALADLLRGDGAPDAAFIIADISDEDEVAAMARTVDDRFGGCDILINNAGVAPRAPFADITLAEWRRVMATNVDGTFLTCRALLPGMIERGYGRIVNLASSALGETISDFCHYLASKGAVVGFTRGLANDFGAQGITANCIAPGLTRTPRTEEAVPDGRLFADVAQARPLRREAAPDDIVGAMSFLASDDAAFITGQTLVVDGGLVKSL